MLQGRRNTGTRFRVSLPVALILLFVGAYLAATVMQAIELLRSSLSDHAG
jgi:hypothetical protein